MNNCTVFVSSADSYSDIWDLFFDIFKKSWPEFEGEIVLNTQEKEYSYPGLNIKCTRVGHLKGFGRTLRAGLDQVKTDNILFFLIDFLLMGKTNTIKLEEYYTYFVDNNLDALCLISQNLPNEICDDAPEISRYLPSFHVFNYQVAFWKKKMLKEMALPHENPWTSEWYGNKRALEAGLDIRCVNNKANNIFEYNYAGCLHRGKWMPDAVEYLTKHNYPVDFSKRGMYKNDYRSLKVRIALKLTFIWHGLKGSYWHHIQR